MADKLTDAEVTAWLAVVEREAGEALAAVKAGKAALLTAVVETVQAVEAVCTGFIGARKLQIALALLDRYVLSGWQKLPFIKGIIHGRIAKIIAVAVEVANSWGLMKHAGD